MICMSQDTGHKYTVSQSVSWLVSPHDSVFMREHCCVCHLEVYTCCAQILTRGILPQTALATYTIRFPFH